MSNYIIKYRWFIIIGFIAVTAFFASRLPKAEIDPEIKNMLPADLPSRMGTDNIEDIFGGSELLMILFETDDVLNPATLKRVKKISRRMKRVKGVDQVMSLFELKNIKSGEGTMIVEPAVKKIPRDNAQREILRREIRENDLVYGGVVSEDFQLTSVIAVLALDVGHNRVIEEAWKLLEEIPGGEMTLVGGFPVVRQHIDRDIRGDMQKLMPVGIAIMLVFLFLCFRQLKGVILPFAVVLMSILFAMGLIPLLGWKLVMISILVPVILIAVANDYGIHIIARYQEDNKEGNTFTSRELAQRTFTHLGLPILLAGLTTFAGMLCLLGHVMVPARQLGILAGAGIVYALLASLLFIPAVLSLLPKSKPVLSDMPGNMKQRILERMLDYFGRLVAKNPRAIIAGSLIFSLASSTGIFFVMVDANPMNYFPKSSPVVKATELIDEHLGGIGNISLLFSGDIKDPQVMSKIDSMEKALGEIPGVGTTVSIARVVRMMSRALNDPGDEFYDVVPETRNAVSQYFELYSMSGDLEDFEKLVDFPYENAVVNARTNTESTPELKRIVNTIGEMVKGDSNYRFMGGFGVILLELADIVIYGQLLSLGLAMAIVMVLIMLLFRSFAAGLISVFPLILSMGILFGLMGFMGVHLNFATAMMSSIMIGVGIDYTLHFLWRYREERRAGLEPSAAAHKTLTTTGRGIVFNALSVVIGFSVLLFSAFMPVKFFGFLVVVSIFACLVGALIIVPSICLVVRPKFLEPKDG